MILCIIQARMGSTRLPGKVLLTLGGQPILINIYSRIKHSTLIDKVIIATTTNPEDDAISQICEKADIPYYRGSSDDVLDRFYQASLLYNPEIVVRVTGDCPFIDSDIVDGVIDKYKNSNVDYCSNVHPPTYPDGLDVEVFSFEALKSAWTKAELKSDREHVTPYIWRNEETFTKQNYQSDEDYSHIRLTLDTKDDFEFIKSVYDDLGIQDDCFRFTDFIRYLKINEKISDIDSKYKRNEGYTKSLLEDGKV